jgi:hypothetical protein
VWLIAHVLPANCIHGHTASASAIGTGMLVIPASCVHGHTATSPIIRAADARPTEFCEVEPEAWMVAATADDRWASTHSEIVFYPVEPAPHSVEVLNDVACRVSP